MKKINKLVYFVLLMVSSIVYASTMNPQEYTNYYIKTLKRLDPTVSVKVVDKFHLEVTSEKSEITASTFLDNAYATYKTDEENLEEITQRYVKNILHVFNAPQEVNPKNIVPVIKDKAYLETLRSMGEGELTIAYESYNKDLDIVYAEDTPERLKYLKTEDLKELNISSTKVRSISIQNLNRILEQNIGLEVLDNCYMLTAGGTFETSLLLAEELWKSRQIKVKGDYVVSIPARGLLFVTGSQNKVGIQTLKIFAKKAETEEAYPITPQLFRFDGEKFVRY